MSDSEKKTSRKYRIFHPLWLAWWSPSLYRDIAFRWRGRGYLYLLLMVLVSWGPFWLGGHLVLMLAEANVGDIYRQIPQIQIFDGHLTIDEPEPYLISHPDTGRPLLVIDTSRTVLSVLQTNAPVLVRRSEIQWRDGNDQPQTLPIPRWIDTRIDRGVIQGWVWSIKRYFIPVTAVGGMIYFVVQNMIYAAIGGWMGRRMGVRIDRKARRRIAAVAITPVTFISLPLFGLWMLDWRAFFVWSALAVIISLGYIRFGLAACRGVSPRPRRAENSEPASTMPPLDAAPAHA